MQTFCHLLRRRANMEGKVRKCVTHTRPLNRHIPWLPRLPCPCAGRTRTAFLGPDWAKPRHGAHARLQLNLGQILGRVPYKQSLGWLGPRSTLQAEFPHENFLGRTGSMYSRVPILRGLTVLWAKEKGKFPFCGFPFALDGKQTWKGKSATPDR